MCFARVFLNKKIACSYEERARCIREISRNCVRPTTFEDFCSRIFAPNLPASSYVENSEDNQDGVLRTFSAPSRAGSLKDPAGVLKLLDMPEIQPFRGRTQSALSKSVKSSEVRVCK